MNKRDRIVLQQLLGGQCCEDCVAFRLGPMLRDELWATIATPRTLLCFACIERRLGRSLSQADLQQNVFNAGWLPYDPRDVIAEQYARGRWLLPPHVPQQLEMFPEAHRL